MLQHAKWFAEEGNKYYKEYRADTSSGAAERLYNKYLNNALGIVFALHGAGLLDYEEWKLGMNEIIAIVESTEDEQPGEGRKVVK